MNDKELAAKRRAEGRAKARAEEAARQTAAAVEPAPPVQPPSTDTVDDGFDISDVRDVVDDGEAAIEVIDSGNEE